MTGATRALGVALAVVALVSACADAPPTTSSRSSSPSPSAASSMPTPAAPRIGPDYVAIGDSYTAGGLIGTLQAKGFRCQRSVRNYPSLVATALDLPLTDASCGGASTSSVLEGDRDLPAQIDAITPRTRVVTVSVGGNDFGLYGKMILFCSQLSKPGSAGAPCRDRLAVEVAPLIPQIGARVGTVLAAVKRRAPRATVLLVGYPRLMPARGSCVRAPYSAGDVAWIASMESRLASAMARAASSSDVRFVPMHARSKGHDLCAGEAAWVNGLDPAAADGLVLHPNAAGERAIADAVVSAVRSSGL